MPTVPACRMEDLVQECPAAASALSENAGHVISLLEAALRLVT